jgi:PASTA domain
MAMSDESDRLRAARTAWERLTGAGREDTGAAALTALSDVGVLRRMLDELELEAVRTARRRGCSWAEIAVKLGVTRQSAWERWRELDPPEPGPRAGTEPSAGATERAASELLDWATRGARRSGQVTVPNVVGRSLDAAHRLLAEHGLVGQLADPDVPVADPERAVVTDQIPESGATARPGAPVRLWIDPGGGSGVREPRRPKPMPRVNRQAADEPADRTAG